MGFYGAAYFTSAYTATYLIDVGGGLAYLSRIIVKLRPKSHLLAYCRLA